MVVVMQVLIYSHTSSHMQACHVYRHKLVHGTQDSEVNYLPPPKDKITIP